MRTDDDVAGTGLQPRPYSMRRPRMAPALGPATTPDLPGCRPVPLPRSDLDAYEGRFEYWDGDTETAWVVSEPTGLAHEEPSESLVELCTLIGLERGASAKFFGSVDLELRDARGERRKILQADQCVYLDPQRARLPQDGGLVVGEHDYPDVVLEVDHTTDVRRWKLGMYESWGFPEVWVEVPDLWSESRPRGLRPGLTIHVLEEGKYRETEESRAFGGWRASAIHEALNERKLTGRTHQRLKQVGRKLGERDGTTPDDHPAARSLRAEGFAEGWAKAVRRLLLSRGIAVSDGFPADMPGFAESPKDLVMAAALACDSDEDFRVRLRRG